MVRVSEMSLDKRVSLVLRGLAHRDEIETICRDSGIDRDVYDQWCSAFILGGTEKLEMLYKAEIATGSRNVDATVDYTVPNTLLLSSLGKLITAINSRDSYTKAHSDDVAEYAIEIGKCLGLDTETMQTLYVAGILHDLGKIGISDSILNKKGRLNDAEFSRIKEHPRVAVDIIGREESLVDISTAVYHHHERYDGTGYPDGLAGEEIPLLSRILAVADAFSAMTTDRPYRPAMSWDRAAEEIVRRSGTQFDPRIASIFVKSVLQMPSHEPAGESTGVPADEPAGKSPGGSACGPSGRSKGGSTGESAGGPSGRSTGGSTGGSAGGPSGWSTGGSTGEPAGGPAGQENRQSLTRPD